MFKNNNVVLTYLSVLIMASNISHFYKDKGAVFHLRNPVSKKQIISIRPIERKLNEMLTCLNVRVFSSKCLI